MPMLVIVIQPFVAEDMYMGKNGVAYITGIVMICIGVGRHIGFLAAAAAVPMFIFVKFPGLVKAVFVGRQREITITNIALVVYIFVDMGANIGLLAAFAGIPMVAVVKFPGIAEAMLVRRQGKAALADIANVVCVLIRMRGNICRLSTVALVPVKIFVKLPFRGECVGVRRQGGG